MEHEARGGGPGLESSEENRRLLDTKARAAADLGRFREMLDRLSTRISGSSVFETLYLIPHGPEHWDACLQASRDAGHIDREAPYRP